MLYPTKTGDTKSWYIHPNFKDDPRVRLNETVTGNMTNGFHLTDNSQVRFSISSDPVDTDIGCSANFATNFSRGYQKNTNDWTNVEQTGFFKITYGYAEEGQTVQDNEIILKGPTGEHHSNTDCGTGSAYNNKVGLENPVNFEHTKEIWHVSYHNKDGPKTDPAENYTVRNHGWFGVKFVNYIKGTGASKIRHLECWLNADGLGLTWKKVLETEDTGGWGDDGDVFNGEPDQILAWGNARQMFRWDFRGGSDIMFKKCSVREINPFATFDEAPTTPDITTFLSTLKLQRHCNYNEVGCVGAGGGLASFYDNYTLTPDGALGITRYYFNTIALGEYAVNSSSEMVGHILHELQIPLRKVGTPPSSPVVRARIYNSSGTLIYTSPTTFDPSTFTTSFVGKTFDFSGNTRVFVSGDIIQIENDTSSSSSFVQVGYSSTTKANSSMFSYEDGPVYVWTNRELVCKMSQ